MFENFFKMTISKNKIHNKFLGALSTYNANAKAQIKISENLFRFIDIHKIKTSGKCLEIGCGTGILSKYIIEKTDFSEIYLNDIVAECFEIIISGTHLENINKLTFLHGDAENINFPDNLNLIISSSTFQWFDKPENFFEKCRKNLKKNGFLIFNTFDKDNLQEIRKITGVGLNYKTDKDILKCSEKHFEIISKEKQEIKLSFNSPTDVLRHLKNTGVNSLKNNIKTKSDLMKFEEEYYKLFRNKKSVELTYSPVYYMMKAV